MVFRLGESPILGLRRAKIKPRWRYVRAKLADVGCMLADVGPSWGNVGAMLA